MPRKWLYYWRNRAKIIFIQLSHGACEECEGIGHNLNVDPNLVVTDPKKVQDGAIEPLAKSTSFTMHKL